jgi:hypothetical protein
MLLGALDTMAVKHGDVRIWRLSMKCHVNGLLFAATYTNIRDMILNCLGVCFILVC